MSQLSQHRQRVPSLGIIATHGRGPVLPSRPSPLSSHPPTPAEFVVGTCSNNSSSEQHSDNCQPRSGNHSRNVSASTWSLPFGSPSNNSTNTFPRKHPSSNFSTPDLLSASYSSTDSLYRQNTNSFAGSSSQLHHLPLAYQLTNQDPSSKLDLANVEAMSHHDNHRHDSFGSQLPVPKGPTNNGRRRSISMQKLFSLSSLKSSFGNSRTSLVSTPSSQNPPQTASSDRPTSDSTTSSRGVKRAAEEDYVVVKHGQDNMQPPLRKRKSSSWFSRRKSGLFTFNSHNSGSAVVDDDMPQGPDAMVLDQPEPEVVRPTIEHTQTVQSHSSSERSASVYTTQTTQLPPVLPPLAPMSRAQTQSSQYSEVTEAQKYERPASHRTYSSQSRVSRSSSRQRPAYSPSAREAFSPPPTLPELTRIETSFGDSDMSDLFAQFGR
ncbi:hypothetical protein E4T50_03707 [Aureobasidium sp. EXF-12298]|nr:hypothetical protein E4T50_03707 [Aureobasidium sp. EXF-12298]